MDPATFSLETATTLISALTLFLSRLDSRRRRLAEIPNLRDSLIALSAALIAWIDNARVTNRIVRIWVERAMPPASLQGLLNTDDARFTEIILAACHNAVITQAELSRQLGKILSAKGDAKSWQSVRHLLRLYGPELLQVLDAAIASRGRLLGELGEELIRLRETAPEELAETLERLESTSQKLDLASMMLDEYIREKFPLNEGRSL